MIYNIERLVNKMKQNGLDAIIASTKENIRYFTGFQPVVKVLNPYFGQCYSVITIDNPETVHIVHSIGEIDQVLDARVQVGKIYTYGVFYREHQNNVLLSEEEERLKLLSNVDASHSNGIEALIALLKDIDIEHCNIGIDEDGMQSYHIDAISNNFKKSNVVSASNILRHVRSVKTNHEVQALTYSARCIENAIEDVAANLFEGISEYEIADIFNCSIAKKGALPVLPMIKVGRHAVGGQRRQSKDIKLMPGDLIWFDCDIVCDGYWADIARVLSYKYMKPEYDKFNALYKGQCMAMQEIQPGMKGSDVFDLTMDAVYKSGFKEYRRHHVGHGIGLEPYELPILAPNNEDVIEDGMVLSVETPYYEFGLGALHVEDPVLISSSGNKILTSTKGHIKIVE
ncbi:M24 family metallopeptidase [Bacillus pretiosus]|uniref:Xaa-Pro peptidase family protein n=1 Tax=Bacillus pretiosus TaxID=2983392 RepID=A0ABT3ENY3_9BACI|nr:Xaa-Pro peptidase family protein [Bacillus pretiosus]MCW1238495.1 Xaa-Pro peptidase family protein [Bacillus pretiosus]